MKFLCPNCKAKYQISDEKIAGRTLKMDCRRCSHPIVIRGETAVEEVRQSAAPSRPAAPAQPAARRRPAPASAAPAPAARSSSRNALGADFRKNAGAPAAPAKPTALDQWHVAINDVPVGPMRRDEIAQKIGAGAVGSDSLCWREGFDDWRPLKSVPELAALLRKPAAPPPPAPARPLGRAAPPAAARPARPPAAARPAAPRPAQPAAEPARPAARGNVVPIGGRLGAAAAPAIDDYSEMDDEPTRVGSGLDLAQLEEEQRLADEARKEAERQREAEARAAREAEEAAAREAEEAAAREAEARRAPSAVIAEEDAFDPFASQRGVSPLAPPMAAAPLSASSPGLAPAPASTTPGFATPPPATVEAPPRRQRAIPVGAWIAIAGAMAFGVTLAVMVGIKLFGQAEAPLAVADPAPTPEVQPTPEPTPEEAPEPVAEQVEEQAPPDEATPEPGAPAQQGTRPQQGTTARPAGESAPRTPQTPRVDQAAAARLAQFQDDGAEAAPIAVGQRNSPLAEDRARGTGELSADQIRTVVNRERAAVQRCYETAARMSGQAPRLRVDVDVTIGASGTVTSATARGPGFGNISECIERSVRRWRFPASGSSTQTSIPFVFQGREQ